MAEIKVYDTAKLTKATRLNLPESLETKGYTFSVNKIQCDEDFTWSIDLKFNEYFETFSTSYNLVIIKGFEGYLKNIDNLISQLKPTQISLEDYEPKKPSTHSKKLIRL